MEELEKKEQSSLSPDSFQFQIVGFEKEKKKKWMSECLEKEAASVSLAQQL